MTTPAEEDAATIQYQHQHNQELLERFAQELLKETPDPDVLEEFIHGPDAKERLGEDSYRKVQNYLKLPAPLSAKDMEHFVLEMHRQTTTALFRITSQHPLTTSQSLHSHLSREEEEETCRKALSTTWRHMTGKSAHMPVQPIEHPDPHIRAAWNRVWDQRIGEITGQPSVWHNMEALLEKRHGEIKHFQEKGELPNWLNPAWFTEERMTLTKENADLGYNHVHNQPLPPLGNPGNTERYLRERMDTHLAHRTRTNGGLNPAEFARHLIRPYLDPDLARDFSHFDADDWYYIGDGPFNYREELELVVLGDTTDPANHARTTYCRLIRDSIMEHALAGDSVVDREDLLAMSLPLSASALHRCAQFGHMLVSRGMLPTPERRELPGFQPVIEWQQDQQSNVKAARKLTLNMSGAAPLREHIDLFGQLLRTFTNPQDRSKPGSSWPQNYPFIPRKTDPGGNDVDHPARHILRETMDDLAEALRLAQDIDLEKCLEQAVLAALAGTLEEKLDQFRGEYTADFVYDIKFRAKGHPRVLEHEYLNYGLPPEQAKQMAAIGSSIREETHPSTPEAALRAAVSRLIHADYNVQVLLRHTDLIATDK